MFEVVEKLQVEREKLTVEFKESRIEYKAEVKRINKAIRKFSQGYEVLGKPLLENPPKRGITAEVENILLNGAKHVKEIVAELQNRGFSSRYQMVSGLLQTYAKANKKFKRVAPATFALISQTEVKNKIMNDSSDQTIVYKELAVGGENEFQARGENEFE